MIRVLTVLAIFTLLWTGGALAACSADRVNLRNDKSQVSFEVELAVTPKERSRGLMFRESLPPRSGMLFVFDPPQPVAFWMKNTLIPLDIVWFDADGAFVGRASMTPCEAEPCPRFSPAGSPDYRYAIEADPGDLDWVDESTVIVYSE